MDSEKVIKRDNEYVLHTYNRNPVVLEKGHGLYAEGPEGQKYLDFTSGIGVNSLGYCDLAWAEAVSQQAHKLQHTSNLYYTAPCGKLAKKLCKRTGMSKVFFGNSGAEANEGAIKAARKYSVDHYGKDRYNVITLVNSFHGRTLATLTATGQEVFHNYFGPFNEGFQYVPAGDIEALSPRARAFHTQLTRLSKMNRILRVIESQDQYITRFSALSIARETRRHAAHREHHQLVDLVEQRDLESFEKLMRKHIERSKETCLLALEESKLKHNEAQK